MTTYEDGTTITGNKCAEVGQSPIDLSSTIETLGAGADIFTKNYQNVTPVVTSP